ncbi:MAG TPA: MMPL family transporter [Acidimicrobiales bacterium]|nr:MMPL family transporter [Acidimicrobiales bacterium]
MFSTLGRVVVRHPWRVIAVWIVAAVAVIGLAPRLSTTSNEASFLPSHYQSVQAQNLQRRAFPTAAAPAAIVVVERADGSPLTPADSARVRSVAAALQARHIPEIGAVVAGSPSANRLIQPVAVLMPNADQQLTASQVRAVKTLRADVTTAVAGTDLRAGVTGTAAQFVDQQAAGSKANAIVGGATIGLILLLLAVIFRSPTIALLPVLVIAAISQVATGLIAAVSRAFGLNIDSTVSSMLIVVLFGVGTDYILFLLFRFRERLRAGDDPRQAMASAIARVGPAVATAAGAVIIAFLALTLSSLGLFRSLGPALAIAVATTLLAGLTLIPAIVTLLGTRVFWPSKAWKEEPSGARFAAIGRALGRRPGRFAAVTGAVMVLLAVVALGFHPTFDLQSGSTATSQSAVWSQQLLKGLPAGATDPTGVYLESTTGARLPAAALAAYRTRLAAVPGVAQVAAARLAPGGTVAEYQVLLSSPGRSDAAMATVSGPLQAAVDTAPPGTRPLIGGVTSVFVDLHKAMNRDYSVVFPVAAVLILVILALLLRSVVAPWYLMVSVGLGFAATLGATVGVFQDLSGDAGLTFILPLIMYLFVVALGTDYNILMVARLREESAEGRNARDAAAMAVRHAGPTVASAGLILAGTFASLILAGGGTLSQMGFAIALGIAISAFVMALFLTPALTALLGERAWWPGRSTGPGRSAPVAAGTPAATPAGGGRDEPESAPVG